MGLADMLKRETTYPDSDYVGPKVTKVDPEKVTRVTIERVPHIEIGKAIIDATDKVREGLSKCESPSEINAYVDILAKIDEMHWKNTEKVMVFGR